ncbi:MAG: hypothetical protein JNK82_21550 [Myxococcaceae bacterium]|nr:hypothetical protein [Myxococcaceae bacterium]
MADAHAHLSSLLALFAVARPGAHYPDARGVREWLTLLATPWAGRTAVKPELDPCSGLPTRRTLEQLHERRRLARAYFEAHRAQPQRSSDQFNAALAAAHLWSPGSHAKVVSAERNQSRLLVVHDRFDESGSIVRFSALATVGGSRHVKLHGTTCTLGGPFELAVEKACAMTTTAAALQLAALEGLTVHEVVRGELGPCVTEHFGALHGLAPGVLSLVLERVGETVASDHCADAWPEDDAHAAKRAARGGRRSRERRLICTPERHAELQAVAAPSRMLVRSR